MTDLSISAAAELLRQKKVSPVDLVTACLDRIERLNPVLNAFITVTHESALAQARVAEDEIQRGRPTRVLRCLNNDHRRLIAPGIRRGANLQRSKDQRAHNRRGGDKVKQGCEVQMHS